MREALSEGEGERVALVGEDELAGGAVVALAGALLHPAMMHQEDGASAIVERRES